MKRIIPVIFGMILLMGMLCIPAGAAKTSVSFASKTVTLNKGSAYTLKPTVTGISKYTLEWSTSSKSVCTVDSNGKIFGVKNGSAVITAKIKGSSVSAKCKVNVVTKVYSVKVPEDKITLELENEDNLTYEIAAEVSPATASDKRLEYSSSAPSVASVSADGVITAEKEGTAVITVKSADGSKKSAVINVTVVSRVKAAEPLPNFDMSLTNFGIVKAMQSGISIGNSLDACEDDLIRNAGVSTELSWGNPRVSKKLIDAIKKKGFKTVRIPVTWHSHVDNDFNVDAKWMARVKEVVDYAIDNDMYVIINMHHDNAIYNLKSAIINQTEYQKIEDHFVKVWSQIGNTFADYDEHLLFESMNSPRIDGSNIDGEWLGGREWLGSAAERNAINSLNAAFVKEIRSEGGNNPFRFLLLTGFAASHTEYAIGEMKFPEGDNRIIFSIHGFMPADFTSNPLASSTFTSTVSSEVDEYFRIINSKIVSKGIPVIVTEMAAADKDNLSERASWTEYFVRKARSYGITCIWWDNGRIEAKAENYGIIDRSKNEFYYNEIADALVKYSK